MSFNPPEKKKIPQLEQEILEFWKNNKIFEKSVDQRDKKDLYVFYDGPPFISGLPHYGHLLGSIAKDLIPRYWTMKGKKVERVWGWDAHGLTVENKVQERLGINNRKEIEDYGLEEFTKECYKYTSEISTEWDWYVDKIGRWVDMENAYKTTDQDYMESVMWAFKQLYDKDLIYEGVRTSLFCPRCGTPVSNFEVAMDNSYKEVEDPAITVKFKITTDGIFKDSYVLAWTTTPWTVPSNRALVVDEDSNYVLVEHKGEDLIVASERLEDVFEGKSYKVKDEFSGKDLVGQEYKRLFEIYESNENDFKIYSYEEMVNMEEGTGIVHSAPGFGDIDTQMGDYYKLSITMAIDDGGKFVEGTINENPYAGMFYAKANPEIRKDLEEMSALFKDERVAHRFPYHDRCDSLLIQKAQNSWFVNVDSLKNKLLKNNKNITWVPEHLKEGRFKQGVKQAPDWCISRTRFWATPMPVWESEGGDRIVVGSIKELEELSGQKVEDLHRPYIDQITIEKNGKVYKRREEVLDSWFEAGSMPYAQFHYPFENKKKFEQNFPGDYIVEYIAQVRAWFYVMHVMSTALFGKNSFKNVITTGVMAGDDGRKMSKTYGNYTDPKQVLNNIGGDALRLFLMSSPLMVGENANFNMQELKTKSNKVLNPLWNSLRYFLIYASKFDWEPSGETPTSDNVLDKWIIVKLNETIMSFTNSIENYIIPDTVEVIEEFVDDLSRWYIRRSRGRISSGNKDALATLYYVLVEFSKTAAPVIPFLADNIYKRLTEEESVHLAEFPEFNKKLVSSNQELLENMEKDRQTVSLVLAQRDEHSISIRQPLSSFKTTRKVYYEDIVKEEVNVEDIVCVENFDNDNEVKLNTEINKDLELKKLAREMTRNIQSARKDAGLSVEDVVDAKYPKDGKLDEVVEKFCDEIMKNVGAISLSSGSDYEVTKKN